MRSTLCANCCSSSTILRSISVSRTIRCSSPSSRGRGGRKACPTLCTIRSSKGRATSTPGFPSREGLRPRDDGDHHRHQEQGDPSSKCRRCRHHDVDLRHNPRQGRRDVRPAEDRSSASGCPRDPLSLYLILRKKWLVDNNPNSHALFPSKDSADGYLSGNAIRSIKATVEDDLD